MYEKNTTALIAALIDMHIRDIVQQNLGIGQTQNKSESMQSIIGSFRYSGWQLEYEKNNEK